jgi:hypothetical protein
MSTRQLVSKYINIASEDYVGRDGELWIDTDTNTMKISDGVNAGGVVITTDGDAQTLSLVGNNLTISGANIVDLSGIGFGLTDISVTTRPVGTTALSYDNATGVFTFTPLDPSSINITKSQITDLGVVLTNITAESIGDLGDVDTTTIQPTIGQVLKWNGSKFTPNDSSASSNVSSYDTPADNAAIDISKQNHFVSGGESYTLGDGTEIGQELKFWLVGGTGSGFITVTKAFDAQGATTTLKSDFDWEIRTFNMSNDGALHSCIWQGAGWVLSRS